MNQIPNIEETHNTREVEEWKERLQVFKFNREKENGYRMTHDDYIEFIELIIKVKDKEFQDYLEWRGPSDL